MTFVLTVQRELVGKTAGTLVQSRQRPQQHQDEGHIVASYVEYNEGQHLSTEQNCLNKLLCYSLALAYIPYKY